jgi:hypothetical protein
MFRFTIRELILLTAIAAMGAGWWVDRARLASRCQMIEEKWRSEWLRVHPTPPF